MITPEDRELAIREVQDLIMYLRGAVHVAKDEDKIPFMYICDSLVDILDIIDGAGFCSECEKEQCE